VCRRKTIWLENVWLKLQPKLAHPNKKSWLRTCLGVSLIKCFEYGGQITSSKLQFRSNIDDKLLHSEGLVEGAETVVQTV